MTWRIVGGILLYIYVIKEFFKNKEVLLQGEESTKSGKEWRGTGQIFVLKEEE
jgi:hypothetical protein